MHRHRRYGHQVHAILLRLLGWAWPGHPTRWGDLPRRLRPTLVSTARLTAATVAAYLCTLPLMRGGAVDLTGALTALLVVQASGFSTLRMAFVRVGAVVTGVLIAVGVSTLAGLTWWSLAVVVAAALVLAKVLRLGHQALETPISAMLILAVQGIEVAAELRVLTTLVGAAVGVAFVLLLPPPVPTRSAASAVSRVARSVAAALTGAAGSMGERPVVRAEARRWATALDEARGQVGDAARVVADVQDAQRLNPRGFGRAAAEPILRSGLDTLEGAALAVRALFAVVAREAPVDDTPDDGYGDEVRHAFSVVLDTMATSLTCFGALVEAEVDGREAEAQVALGESLDALREARAILTELMFVDARSEPHLWLLRGSVLSAVEQVLARLDVEARARVREGLRSSEPKALLVTRAQLERVTRLGRPRHPD